MQGMLDEIDPLSQFKEEEGIFDTFPYVSDRCVEGGNSVTTVTAFSTLQKTNWK